MRITIGERLGIFVSKQLKSEKKNVSDDSACDQDSPGWPRSENALRLAELPSAREVLFERLPEPVDDPGPPRVRGEMVWLHKTAPTLVIEGRPDLSPDDHSAGRRR